MSDDNKNNNNNNKDNKILINVNDLDPNHPNTKLLLKAQTRFFISVITAPISIMYGGVLLSTIALLCARKSKKILLGLIESADYPHKQLAQSLFKPVKIAFVFSIVVLCLNALVFIGLTIFLISAIATGNMQALESMANLLGVAPGTTSTWG